MAAIPYGETADLLFPHWQGHEAISRLKPQDATGPVGRRGEAGDEKSATVEWGLNPPVAGGNLGSESGLYCEGSDGWGSGERWTADLLLPTMCQAINSIWGDDINLSQLTRNLVLLAKLIAPPNGIAVKRPD